MFECMMAWICLLVGVFSENPQWFIASGVFAVATQISKTGGQDDRNEK